MYIMVFALSICAGCAFFYYRKGQRTYQKIDRMLDEILNEESITFSGIKEGEVSALASKAIQIQEKLQYEINLANNEKEQVKSLISDMSHQVKTPLATIVILQELLEDHDLSEADRVNLQNKLHSQTNRLEWILNSLFKMTKLEHKAIAFLVGDNYIKETILEAVNFVYQKADKKGIKISMEEFSDFMLLHNRKWTVEVFVNILENAIKYNRLDAHGEINIRVIIMQFYSRIEIRDNGIGIKEDEIIKIFKRFYRSREVENIEGSGIGLYLSKLILEQEKGYMTVESKYNHGSCFYIYLQNCKN